MIDTLWHYAYFTIPLCALIVDTLVGDPRSSYHPVVLIGRVISFFENLLYKESDSPKEKLIFGACTVLGVLLTVGIVVELILLVLATISPWLLLVGQILCLYISISPRSLKEAGHEIGVLLQNNNLEQARFKLSWIVGRDTAELDESEITRATIETVAENTVDGIISPLFFFILLGPVGAMLYRTANTMDSMLGYKNDRYLYFGRVAARFDDVLNYIPARLTFLLFVMSAYILSFDYKKAWHIGLRDATKHPSPNGGYAEAPVAGALHIRLGGYNSYGSRVQFRAYMGDPIVTMKGHHIHKTIQMMYICTILMIIISTVLSYLWR